MSIDAHQVGPDGFGVRVAPCVPERPGVSSGGAPRAGVLAEVRGERMAGMGLVTRTRALEFRSSQWRSAATHHSGLENVDV